MQTIEHELTYLMKYIPEDIKKYPSREYFDIYIPASAEHPILRIRKRGSEYEITKKFPVNGTDSSMQHEHTIELSQEEFNELEANLRGKRARKIRFLYKIGQNEAEIDLYQDDLAGLAIADFEFPTKEEMAGFTPPDFCLADVTQEKGMAGGMLVGKKYAYIEPILAKYSYKPLFLD